jgi:DnaK suppressor protein
MSAKKPARASKKTLPKKAPQKPAKAVSKAAKKPVAKKALSAATKKPSKPAPKAATAKAVKKTPAKAAKNSPVAKKPSGNLIKAAANKLKQTFSKSPAKPARKAAPAPMTRRQAAKPAKKVVPNGKASVSAPSPIKGLMTEAQIRRMGEKDYMSDAQLNFFRHRLLQMREEVLTREVDVKERLHQREIFADPADRATAEEEHWLDLRLRERESLLLRKIDEALRRIADREFGYCEKTGDPIGIPRLLARPTATVCVDVKGQDERIESQFRDR